MAEAAAATREEAREARMHKSPSSDVSCQSYEMFVGGGAGQPGGQQTADGRSSLTGLADGGVEGGTYYYSQAVQQGGNKNNGVSTDEKISLRSEDADSLLMAGGGNIGADGNLTDSRLKINGRPSKVCKPILVLMQLDRMVKV